MNIPLILSFSLAGLGIAGAWVMIASFARYQWEVENDVFDYKLTISKGRKHENEP